MRTVLHINTLNLQVRAKYYLLDPYCSDNILRSKRKYTLFKCPFLRIFRSPCLKFCINYFHLRYITSVVKCLTEMLDKRHFTHIPVLHVFHVQHNDQSDFAVCLQLKFGCCSKQIMTYIRVSLAR